MNRVILMGRLTREPEIRYSSGENQMAVARYTLAVERRFKQEGEDKQTDFINCVTFRRGAEFAENYLHQGTKIVVSGRIQTGSYTNKYGKKVYTTEVVVEEQEFAESKKAASANEGGRQQNAPSRPNPSQASNDGFMDIPNGYDEELPFRN